MTKPLKNNTTVSNMRTYSNMYYVQYPTQNHMPSKYCY